MQGAFLGILRYRTPSTSFSCILLRPWIFTNISQDVQIRIHLCSHTFTHVCFDMYWDARMFWYILRCMHQKTRVYMYVSVCGCAKETYNFPYIDRALLIEYRALSIHFKTLLSVCGCVSLYLETIYTNTYYWIQSTYSCVSLYLDVFVYIVWIYTEILYTCMFWYILRRMYTKLRSMHSNKCVHT